LKKKGFVLLLVNVGGSYLEGEIESFRSWGLVRVEEYTAHSTFLWGFDEVEGAGENKGKVETQAMGCN